jgi:hypothetical protein
VAHTCTPSHPGVKESCFSLLPYFFYKNANFFEIYFVSHTEFQQASDFQGNFPEDVNQLQLPEVPVQSVINGLVAQSLSIQGR